MSGNLSIEQITTIRNPSYPKIIWVLVKTNDGLEGIGETSYDPSTVEAFIMGEASNYLLGKDPSQIDLLDRNNSGLNRSKKLIGHLNEISVVDFDHNDVVRHPLVSKIVRAYEEKKND